MKKYLILALLCVGCARPPVYSVGPDTTLPKGLHVFSIDNVQSEKRLPPAIINGSKVYTKHSDGYVSYDCLLQDHDGEISWWLVQTRGDSTVFAVWKPREFWPFTAVPWGLE